MTAKAKEYVAGLADLRATFEFVPQSRSRNAKDKAPSLNWRVTLTRGGATFTTDYMQGIGHLPLYNSDPRFWRTNDGAQSATAAAERGVITYGRSGKVLARRNIPSRVPSPELADVIYCLLTDADVLNYSGFEEWANAFGYDTDSRKAEQTYRACLETALKLRGILNIEAAREVFADY